MAVTTFDQHSRSLPVRILNKTNQAAFILIFIVSFSISGCARYPSAMPAAVNGKIDLSKQSFSEQVPLEGQWQFFWKKLLTGKERADKNGVLVDFPFRWDGYILDGKKLPSFGFATYKLTIVLPKNAGPLTISMPDVYSAYKLFINGREVSFNGRVSTSATNFVPQFKYRSVDLPENTDTLRLFLQIANFVHSKGGIKKQLYIAKKDVILLNRQRAEAIDLLLTGCLFMGGLFFLGLYLLGNRDKAILLFSLFSIIYSYRVIGTDNYVLHTLLPNLDFYVGIRTEYVCLFIGIALFAAYTYFLYPVNVSKTVLAILNTICILFAVASLFLPLVWSSQLINPFLVVMLFCLFYVPWVYVQAYRTRQPGSVYALSSTVALMIVFAISLFHYWGLIPQYQVASFCCYMAFFFLQSLVLSHRVSFVLRKARVEAEQGLKVKEEFLSTMSHEIRTPLNSVIGISYWLLKNNPREDQEEQLDVMLFSANNLLALVNDILDYNKIEAGKISFEHIELDIHTLAKNIINALMMSAEDKGIALRLNVDKAITFTLMGDPTRLSQIINNLVHNAIKFTQKGYVEVGIEVIAQTDKNVTLNIRVTDTGIGISKEKQKIIFERFTQADSSTSRGYGGTGLGLAICKKLLELQNTTLQLDSEENKGSTFYFKQTFDKGPGLLPDQNTRDTRQEESRSLNGTAILLVEDNVLNVMVVKKFLQSWGATIDVAVNGLDALDKLDIRRHKLVLMDLHMPEMDGYESSKKMRENGVTIPIIALTANLHSEVEEEVKASGMNDIVVKPFLPAELYRKVVQYVNDQKVN
jgi:signal transduction histidine kinase/CheY-like chemotaxis protein